MIVEYVCREGGYRKVILEVGNFEEYEFIKKFVLKVKGIIDEYIKCMEVVKLKIGLKVVMEVFSYGNLYL